MIAPKYLVPALALVGGGLAATCSVAATMTISSAADATGLATCRTFTGSIAVATSTTDNIALDGVQQITGNLVANNVTKMTELSGDSLTSIGGQFFLNSLTILSSLNFPMLSSVDTVLWEALPALQGLTFTTGLQKVTMLTIDNTQLNSLDGINLQTTDTVTIVNNPYLNEISMQLGYVTQGLTMSANGAQLTVAFPNMMWAYNMSIRDAMSVSIPSLASVNGTLGFYSNEFESLVAPNLTSLGSGLAIVSNDKLTNISMPQLTKIGGGFQIANNTALGTVGGFPLLQTVGGAVDFRGAFTSVAFPAIKSVDGGFTIVSTMDIDSTCSKFQALSGKNSAIHGKYTCTGKVSNPGTGSGVNSGGSGSGSSTGSSPSTSSSSAAEAMLIPGATGLLGVVAAIFGLL